MNTRKDLFSAFQEASGQLKVKPSQQSWQKLSNRMDKRPKLTGKTITIAWLIAVAAIVVLVVSVVFINSDIINKKHTAGYGPAPSNLQDLINTEGCKPFCLVIEGRKELPSSYSKPVRK